MKVSDKSISMILFKKNFRGFLHCYNFRCKRHLTCEYFLITVLFPTNSGVFPELFSRLWPWQTFQNHIKFLRRICLSVFGVSCVQAKLYPLVRRLFCYISVRHQSFPGSNFKRFCLENYIGLNVNCFSYTSM